MAIYLGLRVARNVREIFRSDAIPTAESHGGQYAAVIGPFRTLRGATFMRDHGQGNPHCLHVNDAERLAKLYKQEPIT